MITRNGKRPQPSKVQLLKRKKRKAEQAVIAEVVKEIRSNESKDGSIKRGTIKSIIESYHLHGFDFVSCAKIEYELKRQREKKCSSALSNEKNESGEETPTETEERKRPGRKKGSTDEAKKRKLDEELLATEEAATLYFQAKCKTESEGKRVKKGFLKDLVRQIEKKHNLTEGTINLTTVKTRVKRKNPSAMAIQKTSPIAEIEPLIAEYCCRLSAIGKPLSKDNVIYLAESIIRGTKFMDALLEFKKNQAS